MIKIRKSNERGHFDHGWLDTYHSFSFGDYHDPQNMGFSLLRVINEDQIDGGGGFPTHPHRDMEIVSYVVDGALEHQDTLGNKTVIKPGEVQRMTAGTGIRHSEANHFRDRKTHLLQIWFLPAKQGETPSYDQKSFLKDFESKNFVLVGSSDGKNGSVVINQDVEMYVGKFKKNETLSHPLNSSRCQWVQMIKGSTEINGQRLEAGDGMAMAMEDAFRVNALAEAEFILFDMPR